MDEQQRRTNLAELFKALADPNRLAILKLLSQTDGRLCVNALSFKLKISQSAVSQHLKVLRQQNLLQVEKHGYYKHYSLNPDGIKLFENLAMEVFGK